MELIATSGFSKSNSQPDNVGQAENKPEKNSLSVVVKYNYLSREGYEKLKDELQDLTGRGRREVARQLDEARSKGDLSENAEYEAAKEEQSKLEQRIGELQEKLANAKVLDETHDDTSQVYILSTVTIHNKKTDKEQTYTLVSKDEADFDQGKISVDSPIGSALMGRKEGETVEVDVPAGKLELEIRKIER